MKFEQAPAEFMPITLICETKREAEMIWQAIGHYPARGPVEIDFYRRANDWFRDKVKL